MTTTLLVALSFVFVQSAAYAQESKVDVTKCITLTVKQGVKIRMAFAASTENVWVRVTGVKNEKEEKAPTYLNFGQQEYEVSGTEVKVYGAIIKFSCHWNKENLIALDVSKNTQLTYLNCYGNQLSILDVSKNTQLTELGCGLNQLTSLDISKNTLLTELLCLQNQLTTLDVSANTQLTLLDCRDNKLTTLDVSANTQLRHLECLSNQLRTLDLSKNTQLKWLSCSFNQLRTLDLSKDAQLTELDCRENQLKNLDISKYTQLERLLCSYNQLRTLEVSQNTQLKELWCSSNQLSTLDVSQNTLLTELNCSSNQLSSLDVSQNTKLKKLKLYDNLFSTSALNVIYCQLPNRKSETEKGKINLAYKKGDVTDEVLTKSSSGQIAKDKNWAIQYDRNDTDIEGIEGNFICGGSSKLTLEPTTMPLIPVSGKEWQVTVTSENAWKIDETISLPDWLEVTPKQGTSGTKVTVKAKSNPTTDERKYAIVFALANDATSKEVVILAQMPKPPLFVTPPKVTLSQSQAKRKRTTLR